MPNWLLPSTPDNLIRQAVTRVSDGVSSVSGTKIVWLSNGMLACYCATITTLGGVAVYVFNRVADPVYWGGVTALWTVSLGFAGSVKKNQNQTTKEITLNQDQATKEITLANQSATQSGTQEKGGTA